MVHPDTLRRHVEALCQWERHYEKMDDLARAADYIAGQWEAMGLSVTRQGFTAEGQDFKNLIVRLGPEEGSRFVIGAHYDVCIENEEAYNPGADDNASGVAGLLELTRMVMDTPLPYTLELVAFANEEPPFFRTDGMGSFVHAKSLRNAGIPVKGMIALEMLGYYTDKAASQDYPLELMKLMYPKVGNFITVAGDLGSKKLVKQVRDALSENSRVPVRSVCAPAKLRGIDFSDHRNYRRFKWPAVMLTDTAFYRNPHYHQPTDTPDTLDYDTMAEVVQGLSEFVRNLP